MPRASRHLGPATCRSTRVSLYRSFPPQDPRPDFHLQAHDRGVKLIRAMAHGGNSVGDQTGQGQTAGHRGPNSWSPRAFRLAVRLPSPASGQATTNFPTLRQRYFDNTFAHVSTKKVRLS